MKKQKTTTPKLYKNTRARNTVSTATSTEAKRVPASKRLAWWGGSWSGAKK